jgi:hypothetical protein
MSDNPPAPDGATNNNTPGSTNPGRGGRGRSRNRGRGNRGNRQRSGRSDGERNATPQTFFGNTDGMKGNVFQCHGETTNKQQFLKTVGVLDEHINKTFSYPQDIASVCKDFSLLALTQPANLTRKEYDEDMGKKMIWETNMKSYIKRTEMMESNVRAIYAIVWGQCSPMMQSKLESLDNYTKKNQECDCLWLLKEIQGITHRFEGTRDVFISIDDAWSNYYNYRQDGNQSLHEYLKDFQSLVQVLEHYGASIGSEKPYVKAITERITAENPNIDPASEEFKKKAATAARHRSIATAFLKRADRRRYGALWSELENSYTRGQDHYPVDLTNAYNVLLNYRAAPTPAPAPRQNRREGQAEELSGASFLQNKEKELSYYRGPPQPMPGTDGIMHDDVKCYNCNFKGHYANDCQNSPNWYTSKLISKSFLCYFS